MHDTTASPATPLRAGASRAAASPRPAPAAGRCRIFAGIVLVLSAVTAAPSRAEESASVMIGACTLATSGTGVVGKVLDDGTLVLADGREVRLAGVVMPTDKIAAVPGRSLEALAGHPVTLRRLGEERDRYGRLAAHVFVADAAPERWVQADLLAKGEARVSGRVGDRPCAAELLAREHAAREAKLGLWSDPYYGVKGTEDPTSIAAERGRFAIVEGKVLSVRESGGTIYVNFGRRWSEDFTVTILKRNERRFAAAGIEPSKLEGRRIRIRGWIEERGGPWVEATHPEQIELLERK